MEWIISLSLVLFIAGTAPIAVCLFLTAVVALLLSDVSLVVLGHAIFFKIESYSLLAVLFFILAGNLMVKGAVAEKIINIIKSLVGFFPGGMAIVAVLSCGIFAAISGSSPATVIAIGSFMLPAMIGMNYDRKFSTGLIASSGSLGILIPPSIPMIIYGMIVGVSIGKLFLAGVLPGLTVMLAFSLYSLITCKRNVNIKRETFDFGKIVDAFKDGGFALLLPVVILGGIYGGIFTPTEAAAVAVFSALALEFFLYHKIKLKDLPQIVIESSITTAALMIIVSSASCLGEYLTLELIPDRMAEFLVATIHNKYLFLLVVNIALLFVGTFMDIISAMLILVPILAGTLVGFDINPIHFGIIFIFNLEIGYLTPPLGINLYVAGSLAKMPFTEVVKAVLPTVVIMLICLFIFTYFPQLSLYLPKLMMGN